MGELDQFYIHTATITPYMGKNGYGKDILGTPTTYTGFYDGSQRLIRNQAGEQVVAAGTFYTAVSAPIHLDDLFTCGTITGRVVSVDAHDSGPLGLPDHLAVSVL